MIVILPSGKKATLQMGDGTCSLRAIIDDIFSNEFSKQYKSSLLGTLWTLGLYLHKEDREVAIRSLHAMDMMELQPDMRKPYYNVLMAFSSNFLACYLD